MKLKSKCCMAEVKDEEIGYIDWGCSRTFPICQECYMPCKVIEIKEKSGQVRDFDGRGGLNE